MKNLSLLAFFFPFFILAQFQKDKDWTHIEDENIKSIKISKVNTIVEIDNFRFEMLWDEKLSYSENLGNYGGVAEIKVYKNGKSVQILGKIEDSNALDFIDFTFYDYNMDGHIDFSYFISCGKGCWPAYYLYNPMKQNFEHVKEWDYIKPWELNKVKKQFLTVPDGTAMEGEQKRYQIDGLKLKVLETIYYGK